MSTMKSLQGFMKDYQEDLTIMQYSRLLDMLNDLTITMHMMDDMADILQLMLEVDSGKHVMDPTKMKTCDRDLLKVTYHKVIAVRELLGKGVSE